MTKRIETDNLVLRKAADRDLKPIWRNIWSDDEIARTMLWKPTHTEEEARSRLERTKTIHRENDAFFVCLKDSDEPIGFCGIRPAAPNVFEETGICIARKYQGLGYGKEVLKALVDLAFGELGGRSFVYGCFRENTISAALCKGCGFVYTHSVRMTREWDGYGYICDFYILEKDGL